MNMDTNERTDPVSGKGRSEAVRTFFDDVLQEVKFSWDHDEIRTELEEHILEECAYLETKGLPAEEAETEAVRRMGDPENLGKLLNTAHQP